MPARRRSRRDVRVVLVDGDSLQELIAATERAEVVAIASGLLDALYATSEATPEVVAIDAARLDAEPADAIRRLRERSPESRVVLFAADRSEDTLVDLIVAGAAAYLPLDLAPAHLHALLGCVTRGGVALDPWAARVLLQRFGPGTRESATGILTRAERALLERLAAAPSQCTTDETAAALAASACAKLREATFICA